MATGRSLKGRFALGNKCGPGRPRRAREEEYCRAFREGVTLEDWRRIVRRAVEQALAGDAAARNFLARHLLPAIPRESTPQAPANKPSPVETSPEADSTPWTPMELADMLLGSLPGSAP